MTDIGEPTESSLYKVNFLITIIPVDIPLIQHKLTETQIIVNTDDIAGWGSNSLSVLVKELDDHQGSFQEAVSDVGWKTLDTPDLPGPEETATPAPDHLLVAVTGVRHHTVRSEIRETLRKPVVATEFRRQSR